MNTHLTASCLALSTVLAAQAGFARQDAPRFNTGVPLADVLLAQLGSPGLLDIVATDGQQQIEVTIGPIPGRVQVQGVSGISSDMVFTGITSIRVRTGSFTDFVAFRSRSTVVPEIWVNTAGGDSDVIVDYDIPSINSVVSNVTVLGGAANDKVAFLVDSRANRLTLNWDVSHRSGDNEAIASISSPEDTQNLTVDFMNFAAGGKDKYETAIIHAAETLNVMLNAGLGNNEDEAKLDIDSLQSSNMFVDLFINLSAGKDKFDGKIISRGGSTDVVGAVLGKQGIDTMTFTMESNGNVDLLFRGDDSSDLLDMFFKGNVTGDPRLIAGDGDDELKIVVDGPQNCDPFLNGGAGYDKAIGFGTIINCEEIN